MNINRDALKILSDLNIDSQCAHPLGIKIFNHTEEPDPEFRANCAQLSKILDDLKQEVEDLKACIPVF